MFKWTTVALQHTHTHTHIYIYILSIIKYNPINIFLEIKLKLKQVFLPLINVCTRAGVCVYVRAMVRVLSTCLSDGLVSVGAIFRLFCLARAKLVSFQPGRQSHFGNHWPIPWLKFVGGVHQFMTYWAGFPSVKENNYNQRLAELLFNSSLAMINAVFLHMDMHYNLPWRASIFSGEMIDG